MAQTITGGIDTMHEMWTQLYGDHGVAHRCATERSVRNAQPARRRAVRTVICGPLTVCAGARRTDSTSVVTKTSLHSCTTGHRSSTANVMWLHHGNGNAAAGTPSQQHSDSGDGRFTVTDTLS